MDVFGILNLKAVLKLEEEMSYMNRLLRADIRYTAYILLKRAQT